MTTYNNNDFEPETGKRIRTDGSVANPADGVDNSGNQGMLENGRKSNYQRVLVGATINASGSISNVINVGQGTKAIQALYKTTAAAQMMLYPCDASGNPMSYQSLANTASTTALNGAAIIQEYAGSPYVAVYVFDKSAATNTCSFVDVWWTMA